MSYISEKIDKIHANTKEIKSTLGNTIMMLDDINSSLNADVQSKVEEAYQNGYKACMQENDFDSPCTSCEAYQRGVEDRCNETWKVARKISVIELNSGLTGKELMKIYGTMDIHKIYDDNTASEAIEKLKAYEEKQKADEEIKVGDEVIDEDDEKFWVTKIHNGIVEGIVANGEVTCTYLDVTERTGRHIDIEKILNEMRK